MTSIIAFCSCCTALNLDRREQDRQEYTDYSIKYLLAGHKIIYNQLAEQYPGAFYNMDNINQLINWLEIEAANTKETVYSKMLEELYNEIKALKKEIDFFAYTDNARFETFRESLEEYTNQKRSLEEKYSQLTGKISFWQKEKAAKASEPLQEKCKEIKIDIRPANDADRGPDNNKINERTPLKAFAYQ